GDDITYSGTVAAAFEGIILGIPAVAISQQSSGGGMGYVSGRFDFSVAAAFAAQLVGTLIAEPMPSETLINVNCPAGEPTGIEVTKLGKRLYNDELKLVSEDENGRRHYEIYGWQPGFEELEGTDLTAIAQGRIAVTPIHFDLTDHGGLERLRGWRFEEMLAASAPAA
ncbi:MAG TPA: 5'/3'-nucleotidase SurE, partial [Solirubrobacterales bacterium]|nr:5'/3'-nucleotidase SurE [Solirubrobacterales bacterium]